MHIRKILILSFFTIAFLTGRCLAAEEVGRDKEGEVEVLREQLQEIEKRFEEMLKRQEAERRRYETELQVLQEQMKRLIETRTEEKEEKKLESKFAETTIKERPASPPLASAKVGTSTLKLIDISFNSLFTAGASTASERDIDMLQGGAHDPKKRGFTVQNLELSMLGAVDPYLNGEVHLIFQIDKEGESILEVEEAFLTTQTLPYGLQIKAGTYFTEFGRLNQQHPHMWSFVDQPIINTRLLGGDGLRGPGARLSWLTPLSWYSELILGVQNANGETAFSFLSTTEEGDFAGFPIIERDVESLEDLLYSTRWLNSFSLSDEVTLNVGASALFGPNATGKDNRTNIYGADLYLKWKPLINDRGFPFLAWQTEVMKRDYEAGPAKESLDDWGLYTQLTWGFKRGRVAGLRYELVDGDGAPDDSLRDQRYRLSPNLTWFPTEFSKLRLQYNYDRAEFLKKDEQHSAWLQFEFLLGSHGKHKF